MPKRSCAGFTLLELLVVIGLIVLLAGLLFPVLAGARDAARRTRCLSNLHQISLAHLLYIGEYDDTLPSWMMPGRDGPVLWTDILRPYYRDARLLDEGLTTAKEKQQFEWLADYALCAWGPGGEGTAEKPYWRWPGAPTSGPAGPRMMTLAEVIRPTEALQFADGLTLRYTRFQPNSVVRRRHRNGVLNGAFLDGRARAITDMEWNRVDQDERGYFYAIAAADRPAR
jgi:prepilin-type N-terminal cleavage/methylation domain-containing protein